jgi:hypothetical protein
VESSAFGGRAKAAGGVVELHPLFCLADVHDCDRSWFVGMCCRPRLCRFEVRGVIV